MTTEPEQGLSPSQQASEYARQLVDGEAIVFMSPLGCSRTFAIFPKEFADEASRMSALERRAFQRGVALMIGSLIKFDQHGRPNDVIELAEMLERGGIS